MLIIFPKRYPKILLIDAKPFEFSNFSRAKFSKLKPFENECKTSSQLSETLNAVALLNSLS